MGAHASYLPLKVDPLIDEANRRKRRRRLVFAAALAVVGLTAGLFFLLRPPLPGVPAPAARRTPRLRRTPRRRRRAVSPTSCFARCRCQPVRAASRSGTAKPQCTARTTARTRSRSTHIATPSGPCASHSARSLRSSDGITAELQVRERRKRRDLSERGRRFQRPVGRRARAEPGARVACRRSRHHDYPRRRGRPLDGSALAARDAAGCRARGRHCANDVTRHVVDPGEVARIVGWFNALNVVQPNTMVLCGFIATTNVQFTFRSAAGAQLASARVPSAAASSCDEIQFTLHGQRQTPLIDSTPMNRLDFAERVQRLLGVQFGPPTSRF